MTNASIPRSSPDALCANSIDQPPRPSPVCPASQSSVLSQTCNSRWPVALHPPSNLARPSMPSTACTRRQAVQPSSQPARFQFPSRRPFPELELFPAFSHPPIIPRSCRGIPGRQLGSAESLFQPRNRPFPVQARYGDRLPLRSFVSSPIPLLYLDGRPLVICDVAGYLHQHALSPRALGKEEDSDCSVVLANYWAFPAVQLEMWHVSPGILLPRARPPARVPGTSPLRFGMLATGSYCASPSRPARPTRQFSGIGL